MKITAMIEEDGRLFHGAIGDPPPLGRGPYGTNDPAMVRPTQIIGN